jgi:hypothetical protein
LRIRRWHYEQRVANAASYPLLFQS